MPKNESVLKFDIILLNNMVFYKQWNETANDISSLKSLHFSVPTPPFAAVSVIFHNSFFVDLSLNKFFYPNSRENILFVNKSSF